MGDEARPISDRSPLTLKACRYKTSVEDYEDRLEENEKRHNSQFEELQAAIRKKEVRSLLCIGCVAIGFCRMN